MSYAHDTIAEARAAELDANRKRSKGDLQGAAVDYQHAAHLYRKSGGSFLPDEELAADVLRSMKRCDKKASNCHHPQERRKPATNPCPRCANCNKKLPRYKLDDSQYVGADGKMSEWGRNGDNVLCGMLCGYRYAVKVLRLVHKRQEGSAE